MPPDQPVIRGLQTRDLARVWQDVGLACTSWAGSTFTLHCEMTRPEANAQVVAEAEYFTLDGDGVIYLNVVIVSIDDGRVDSNPLAKEIFARTAELVGDGSATKFILGNIGSDACSNSCAKQLDGSVLSITVGVDGFQSMDIVGQSVASH